MLDIVDLLKKHPAINYVDEQGDTYYTNIGNLSIEKVFSAGNETVGMSKILFSISGKFIDLDYRKALRDLERDIAYKSHLFPKRNKSLKLSAFKTQRYLVGCHDGSMYYTLEFAVPKPLLYEFETTDKRPIFISFFSVVIPISYNSEQPYSIVVNKNANQHETNVFTTFEELVLYTSYRRQIVQMFGSFETFQSSIASNKALLEMSMIS